MSVAALNNVATQDSYVDALTVIFPRPRPSFTLHVFNAAIFYTIAVFDLGGRDATFAPDEHMLLPSLNNFRDPVTEGFPPGTMWAGIKLRSAVAGTPGNVIVA